MLIPIIQPSLVLWSSATFHPQFRLRLLEAWISPSIQPSWPTNSEEVIKDQQSFTPWKTLQKSCRNSSRTKIRLNGVVISVIHTREDECKVRIHFEKCCIHLRDPLSVLVWFKEFMYYFFQYFYFYHFLFLSLFLKIL